MNTGKENSIIQQLYKAVGNNNDIQQYLLHYAKYLYMGVADLTKITNNNLYQVLTQGLTKDGKLLEGQNFGSVFQTVDIGNAAFNAIDEKFDRTNLSLYGQIYTVGGITPIVLSHYMRLHSGITDPTLAAYGSSIGMSALTIDPKEEKLDKVNNYYV